MDMNGQVGHLERAEVIAIMPGRKDGARHWKTVPGGPRIQDVHRGKVVPFTDFDPAQKPESIAGVVVRRIERSKQPIAAIHREAHETMMQPDAVE